MTTKRVTMHKIKDILRLKYSAELSIRQITLSLALSIGVVSKYLSRAKAAGLGWPLPEGMSDAELAALLQTGRTVNIAHTAAEPDFTAVQAELRRKGMTLQLLWQEYAEVHPDGHYSYSHFTVRYRQW